MLLSALDMCTCVCMPCDALTSLATVRPRPRPCDMGRGVSQLGMDKRRPTHTHTHTHTSLCTPRVLQNTVLRSFLLFIVLCWRRGEGEGSLGGTTNGLSSYHPAG